MKHRILGLLFISVLMCCQSNAVAQDVDSRSIYDTLAEVATQLENGDTMMAYYTLHSAIKVVSYEVADSSLFQAIDDKVQLLAAQMEDTLTIELHQLWAGYLRQIFRMNRISLHHLELAIQTAKGIPRFAELDLIMLLNQKVLTLGGLQEWAQAKLVLLELTQRCEAGQHFKMLPTLYHNLGFVKMRLLEDGIPEVLAGIEFLHQYDSTSQEGHNLYNTLGRQYLRIQDYRSANKTFREYVEWTDRLGFEQVPRAVVGLITSHIRIGEVVQAEEIEGVFINRLTKLTNIEKLEFYTSIADAYIQFDAKKTIEYAKKGLNMPVDVYRSQLNFLLGFGYLEVGRFAEALDQMQLYIEDAFPGYDRRKLLANPKYQEAKDSRNHRPLAMKGRILMEIGIRKNDVELVKAGYESLLVGDSILQAFRSDLSRIERHRWNENQLFVSWWGAAIADRLLRMTQDPRYLEEIFRWSEKSKSLAHLDKLSREDLWRQLDIPNELIARENELVAQIGSQGNGSANPSSDTANMRMTHVKHQHELDLLRRKMEHEYPQYFHLQHLPSTVSLRTLQSILDKDQALLSYFIADSNIYSFLIEPDTVHYILLKDPSEKLAEDFIALQEYLEERSPSYFTKAKEIYLHIVYPLLQKTEALELTVITDRGLSLLPFDLLVSDIGSQRYLLQDYTISQYPSASLYVRPKLNLVKKGKVMAMSPSFDDTNGASVNQSAPRGIHLEPLPGSKEEVHVLESLWPGIFLFDEEATETILKQDGHNYQVIHLSSHTMLNQEDEVHDGIALSADKSNDGLLNKLEIYRLELGADLVTLSACNTGAGELNREDGVSSIANAFHYAGCRNILMSMWAVQDATTVQFMTSFYKLLKTGYSLPAANRQAKIDFLSSANPKFRHPYYWGGFVLMGHHDTLDISGNRFQLGWLWILGPLIFGLIALRYFRS